MSRKKRRKSRITNPEPAGPAPVSSRWRFFVMICAFFFLAALLMRLDVITAWPGAEGFALFHAIDAGWGDYLPAALNHALLPLGEDIDTQTDALFLFPRLVSVLSLLLTAFFTYRWGGRLFGKRVAELTLLCAAASLYLPFFGKVATADALGLLGHAGMFWTAMLYGIGGERGKLFPFGVFTLLASIVAPVSTLLLALALTVLSVFQRTEFHWRAPAGIGLAMACLVLLTQGIQGANTYWFYGQDGNGVFKFVGYALLGMLPLAGWLIGGFRDLAYKLAKFEQYSLIVALGLLSSLVAESLLFLLLLALMAGKQMQLYFREPNYPWRDFVKSSSVLHLILAFVLVFLSLAGGGIAFSNEGFRAALGMAAAYWIFSLLSTIGLFGHRRDFAIGGSLLSGLLAVMFFWVQVYPYIEAERSWPKRLIERVGETATLRLPSEGDEPELSSALPYFRRAGWQIEAEAPQQLISYPANDTTIVGGGAQVQGRSVLRQYKFDLVPAE